MRDLTAKQAIDAAKNGDAEFIEACKHVNDPLEVLKLVSGCEGYFGYDPYYADIRSAVMDAVHRLVEEPT